MQSETRLEGFKENEEIEFSWIGRNRDRDRDRDRDSDRGCDANGLSEDMGFSAMCGSFEF